MLVESLAENLFFTTVRIDTRAANGALGSGTGFLYTHRLSESQHAIFVVTNKHVVQGVQAGSLTFHQKKDDKPNLGTGFRLDINDWPQAWFGHPSPDIDIAVVPFIPLETHIKQQAGVELFYRCVDSNMLPSATQLEQLDAIESVTFIGYPDGIWDRSNLIPVARRGTTASPIVVDFEGTPRFIIDASVFGGSSGSPVFILNQGMYSDKRGNTVVGSRLIFVGVVAAVFFRTELNQIVAVPVPTQNQPMAQQREMLDLGIVFKARTVVETIEAFIKARGDA
ncbi:trypsin-like serine peptidase [Methylococcus mesophilus]|uniref:trypsin-like serine peptidase n=1 Tax=Methylococcus mesophilus TaxID=2993564 RepID=UPI00224AF76C|nr:serine protease [Methylococcus mesophilus]UZR28052.1 serine protease [Methylococcus mesophilus]